jgi:hypothetical protein
MAVNVAERRRGDTGLEKVQIIEKGDRGLWRGQRALAVIQSFRGGQMAVEETEVCGDDRGP